MPEYPGEDTLEVLSLLDELRVIAENGLAYADDPDDEQRCSLLQELVETYYGRTLDRSADAVAKRLREEFA